MYTSTVSSIFPATAASCRCCLHPLPGAGIARHGILMIGTLPTLRLGLSFASLWGVLSFSMCGLSFPAMGMHPVLQALANLFPLRHYFLIYVDQALNGYPMIYSWVNYVALLIFMMLPFLIAHRLKGALVYYKYMP